MSVLTSDFTPIVRYCALLILSCCGLSGCSLMSLEHAEQQISYKPVAEDTPVKSSSACSNSSHVYVYFIHGLDPCDYANLRGVEQYCQDLGFTNTVYVTLHQGSDVVSHVRCTKANDPQARIVIYGYSAGAAVAKRAVNKLHDYDGIDVDLLIYVSGIVLIDTQSTRPEYVGKIIHILDGGKVIPGMQLTGAENYRFTDVWHFGTPMHPRTLAILKTELEREASLVGQTK